MVLGGIIAFVPLFPQPSSQLTGAAPDSGYNVSSAFSLTGRVPVQVTWTSNVPVQIAILTCSSVKLNLSSNSLASICQDFTLVVQNGTSGSMVLQVKPGGTVLIGLGSSPPSQSTPSNGSFATRTATINVRLAQPMLGTLLLVVGGPVLVAGALMRQPRRMRPAWTGSSP